MRNLLFWVFWVFWDGVFRVFWVFWVFESICLFSSQVRHFSKLPNEMESFGSFGSFESLSLSISSDLRWDAFPNSRMKWSLSGLLGLLSLWVYLSLQISGETLFQIPEWNGVFRVFSVFWVFESICLFSSQVRHFSKFPIKSSLSGLLGLLILWVYLSLQISGETLFRIPKWNGVFRVFWVFCVF